MTNYDLVAIFLMMLEQNWSYISGASVKGKVDRVGAFVYAFRLYGMSIAHSTNTIWRQHMADKGQLGYIEMMPGMPVFKRRMDGGEPAKHKDDGIGNLYHMGLYIGPTAQYPEGAVIHAKGERYGIVIDSIRGGWTHAGKLANVTYLTEETMQTDTALVAAPTGEAVNLRESASTASAMVTSIPLGERVTVLERGAVWTRVSITLQDKPLTGWLMDKFLKHEGGPQVPKMDRDALIEVYNQLGELQSKVGEIIGYNG